jgi:hypothetical protein
VRFIHQYPREYDLARLNQRWFKELVFGPPLNYDTTTPGGKQCL